MSKTRATRPPLVRAFDRKDRSVNAIEVHDHENGPCDLPDADPKVIRGNESETRCYYMANQGRLTGWLHVCKAPCCSFKGGSVRRSERRELADRLAERG